MAYSILLAVAAFGTLAIVKGTYVNGRFESSYSDNGFDDSGVFVGDADMLGSRYDDSLMYEDVAPYVGGGVLDRGIGESLSAGILGSGLVDDDFGVSSEYGRVPRIGGGIGGIQRGISGGILGGRRGILGGRRGILGGRRRSYGKYGRRRVTGGIAGFARSLPRRVIGMGGILGARRRSWKLY